MANMHKVKLRGVRGLDDQLWDDFATTVDAVGSDRSRIIREFVEWFVRRPGAELPERPRGNAGVTTPRAGVS